MGFTGVGGDVNRELRQHARLFDSKHGDVKAACVRYVKVIYLGIREWDCNAGAQRVCDQKCHLARLPWGNDLSPPRTMARGSRQARNGTATGLRPWTRCLHLRPRPGGAATRGGVCELLHLPLKAARTRPASVSKQSANWARFFSLSHALGLGLSLAWSFHSDLRVALAVFFFSSLYSAASG